MQKIKGPHKSPNLIKEFIVNFRFYKITIPQLL